MTLGALSVWGGLALLLSDGRTIPRAELPDAFRAIGTLKVGPVPIQIIALIVVVALGWYVLNHTKFGKEVKAIGGNERAARLMGVNVKRSRFFLFVCYRCVRRAGRHVPLGESAVGKPQHRLRH